MRGNSKFVQEESLVDVGDTNNSSKHLQIKYCGLIVIVILNRFG